MKKGMDRQTDGWIDEWNDTWILDGQTEVKTDIRMHKR